MFKKSRRKKALKARVEPGYPVATGLNYQAVTFSCQVTAGSYLVISPNPLKILDLHSIPKVESST